ncbi:MAG: AraC family transcriptional regulator [Verrucomicrobiota bacterium]
MSPHSQSNGHNYHKSTWEGPHFQVFNSKREVLKSHIKHQHYYEALEKQFIVSVVESGSMTYETQATTRKLHRGTLYFIPQPSQTTIYLSKDCKRCVWYWVAFKGRWAVEALEYLTYHYGFIHTYLDSEQTIQRISNFTKRFHQLKEKHQISKLAYGLYHDLWKDIESHNKKTELSTDEPPSSSALLSLDCITFNDYARKLGYSPSHLSRILKEIWGKPPGATIRQMRLDEAARLLKDTTLPAKEIANQVGYLSASSFNRAFTARFGKTPMDYRRNKR